MSGKGNRLGEAPPVIAVCGVKNSGKTTLLTRVLPLLRKKGLRVAVIKHDGHDFDPDVKGTDSYKLRAAGALGVAVYSGRRFMVAREEPGIDAVSLLPCFRDMDLILLEGGKNSRYPKVEIARAGVSERLVSDPHTLLALCADSGFHAGDAFPEGVPRFSLTDYPGIADALARFCREMRGE